MNRTKNEGNTTNKFSPEKMEQILHDDILKQFNKKKNKTIKQHNAIRYVERERENKKKTTKKQTCSQYLPFQDKKQNETNFTRAKFS